MRYFLFIFCCLTIFSCRKEIIQHEKDIQLIKEYLSSNNINAVEDQTSNLFYTIYSDSGDSLAATRNNGLIIEVKYKAYLLDGTTVYDTGSSSTRVALDGSIYGWQLAIPKMDIKDKMLLFLPSRLAYGEEGHDDIPPNAVVIFDIELIDIFPHF